VWERELEGDKDRDFLLEGIKYGFRVVDKDVVITDAYCENAKSANSSENFAKVESKIKQELSQGNYVATDVRPTIVSSLGAVPKSDSDIRVIHDCSRPAGLSVNDYVTTNAVTYDTIDKAMANLPPGGFMAKLDLKNAYRSVPVHPDCYPALGMQWQFSGEDHVTYMFDTKLPFGAARSPEIFQRLTASISRMMKRKGYEVTIVYLDDFLVISSTKQLCASILDCLRNLVEELGLTVNYNKLVHPSQKITFLGIDIDSVDGTLSLPEQKLADLKECLGSIMAKKRVKKLHLQQLLGKLNWASRAVYGGRTFLRRLIDLCNSVKRKHHYVYLGEAAKSDLRWWVNFCDVFNGTTFCLKGDVISYDEFATDACNVGGGGVFCGDWFYTNWRADYPDICDEHINVKEMAAVVEAARRWCGRWTARHVIVYTDNMVTMFGINRGTSTNPILMNYIRELFWLSAVHSFRLTSRHIPGLENVVSDRISRLHDSENRDWITQHTVDSPTSHMTADSLLSLQDHWQT